jgi:hypothetical protein
LKLGNLIPQYEKQINNTLRTFLPNTTLSCPVKPSKFYSIEVMEYTGDPNKMVNISSKKTDKNGFGFELPNGKYRFTLSITTEDDPFVFFLQWQLEVKIRFNDEEF